MVRSKKLNSLGKMRQKELRKVNSTMVRYATKTKIYNSWKNKLDLIKNGCQNCKRKEPSTEHSGTTPYPLSFTFHPENTLIKRQTFRFIHINDSSEDLVGSVWNVRSY